MSHWEKAPRPFLGVGVVVLAALMSACNSDLVLATWTCKRAAATTGQADAGPSGYMSFDSHWSTGFESGFNDYYECNGSCYTIGSATNRIVEKPVHSGRYAAAFTVLADGSKSSTNSRCHRDGELPRQAWYSAWYYIPALATSSGNWNLIHFQGGDGPGSDLFNTLDISLANGDNGGLRLVALVRNSGISAVTGAPTVPIGTWFEIEVFFKRAADATGEVSVSQDGEEIATATNLITDPYAYGQWYVGNLATALSPAESTVYVDDVSVRAEP